MELVKTILTELDSLATVQFQNHRLGCMEQSRIKRFLTELQCS